MIGLLLITIFILNLYSKSKYQELISYLIVGVLTTIVSIVSYYLLRLFIDNYIVCTIISWIIAIIFAYIANSICVFTSRVRNIFKEFISFVFSRLLSLGIEIISMMILVDLFKINDRVSKILVQILVIVLNYVFSKIFVFKRKD